MLKKKFDSISPILDTTQIHKPANINNSHNQLTQSIVIIPTYSITNSKVNSTLTITIQQIMFISRLYLHYKNTPKQKA
jgi:hypothetical protein